MFLYSQSNASQNKKLNRCSYEIQCAWNKSWKSFVNFQHLCHFDPSVFINGLNNTFSERYKGDLTKLELINVPLSTFPFIIAQNDTETPKTLA